MSPVSLDLDALETALGHLSSLMDHRPDGHAVAEQLAQAWPDPVGQRHAAALRELASDIDAQFAALARVLATARSALERARQVRDGGITDGGPAGAGSSPSASLRLADGSLLSGRVATAENKADIDLYRSGTRTQKLKAAENLGEAAGVLVLSGMVGQPVRKELAGTVPPTCTPGVPWQAALTWRGAHVVNMLFWDGTQLIVVECKGGDSRPGTREAKFERHIDGTKVGDTLKQGEMSYLCDVALTMRASADPGRRAHGRMLDVALMAGNVKYIGVRCGPASRLRRGDVDDTAVKVFFTLP